MKYIGVLFIALLINSTAFGFEVDEDFCRYHFRISQAGQECLLIDVQKKGKFNCLFIAHCFGEAVNASEPNTLAEVRFDEIKDLRNCDGKLSFVCNKQQPTR